MPHYVIVDVETSGLFDYLKKADAPGQPRMAQIGMIFVDHAMKIEAEHEFLIKPDGWKMTKEASEVTGFSTDFLMEHGVSIREPLQLYDSAIKAGRVVAGFNVQFDLKMGRAELRRAGMEDSYLKTRNLCLMWASRAIVGATDAGGKVKIPKLEEACAFFGIEQPKAHSALADCHSVHQLMLKLVERGALPEPKSPYNKIKKPKKKKSTKKPQAARRRSRDADLDILGEDTGLPGDFIGGANADGK